MKKIKRIYIFFLSFIFIFFLGKPALSEPEYIPPDLKDKIFKCVKNKDYHCGINYLNDEIRNSPQCPECYLWLGILNCYLGNHQESIVFLERAVEQSYLMGEDGGSIRSMAWFAIGMVYNKINQCKKAEETLGKSIDHFKNQEDFEELFFAESLLEMVRQHNNDIEATKKAE